jgi:MipA family protein
MSPIRTVRATIPGPASLGIMKAAPARFAAFAVPAAIAGALLFAGSAAAQERPARIVTIGVGAQVYPKFPGGDELGLFPMPIIDFRREGEPLPFEAADDSFGFGLLGRDSRVNVGPAVRMVNKRTPEDVGAPVDRVGRTVEVGAFAEAYVMPAVRLRAEGRKGLGGHRGWSGEIMADYVMRGGETWIASIGPRLRIADADYMNAFYGITPAAAVRTGLPVYTADAGIQAVGAITTLRYQISPAIGVHSYAGYDRLTGDAAESPIVRGFGSRDQFSAGLGLSYSFRVGR